MVVPVTAAAVPDAAPDRVEVDVEGGAPSDRLSRWLAPDSPAPIYLGVALITVGAGLIVYTWARVAALVSVPLQLPYLASSGLTGLGLVIVGSLVVSLAVKRRDAAERSRQLEELALLLGAMSTALQKQAGDKPGDKGDKAGK